MEVFMLIRKNIPEYIYPYYILMTKERDVAESLSEFQEEYPESEVVLSLTLPDSNALFERLKDEDWTVWSGGNIYPEAAESIFIDRIMYLYKSIVGDDSDNSGDSYYS